MNEIIELSLEDRDTITAHLLRYPPEISEHTFTNLFVWRHFRKIFYLQVKDAIAFLTKDPVNSESFTIFGPPVGTLSLQYLVDLLGNSFGGAIRIPLSATTDMNSENLLVTEDRDNADYVYLTENLSALKGRNYSKKRNLIKQCMNKYSPEFELISEQNIGECMAMQERWCEDRHCERDISLCGEFQAIRDSFDYYNELQLQGCAIRIDGRIEAFAVGEQLHPGTAVCHFEKATPGFTGLGQLINNQFALNNLDFTFINREQDLGIEGIRQAKNSYHPDHLVMKQTIGPAPQFTWKPGCVSDSDQ